jgi:hypothetical protein
MGAPVPEHEEERMDKEFWGVFTDYRVDETYLVSVFEDEEDAIDYAREEDQRQFEVVMEEGEGDAPEWEDFDGMHYVERVSAELAADARDQLARAVAVRVE